MLAFRRIGRGCAPALLALGACVSPLSLEGRSCPCAEGFVCCASTNTCARSSGQCPSDPSRDAESQEASIAGDGSSTGEEREAASDASGLDASDASSDVGDASVDTSNESAAPIDAALETTIAGDAPNDRDARNDRDAPTDAAVADERADGPTGDADALASPSWQAVGDLNAYSAGQYEFQVVGGVPFLGLHRFMFPGRSRTCVALRYDGSTWQQLGADLPGTEVLAFAVSSDGTPHMISTGSVQAFQQGQWRALPDLAGYLISAGIPALAFDRNNRLHALAVRSSTATLAVVRFNGTTWDVLGSDDAFGPLTQPSIFGFDATAPYLASHNNDTSQTEVRRFGGTTWDFVGGGPMPIDSFDLKNIAVSRSGVVYVAEASNGIVRWWQGGPGPWTSPVTIGGYAGQSSVVPSLELSADDTLHVAYLTDRDPGPGIVPGPVVSRLSGSEAQDLSVAGLDLTLFDAIKLKMARIGSRDVPYIAFERNNVILVRKLE